MNKKKREEVIKELIDFVEGRKSFDEFEKNYNKNSDYFKVLDANFGGTMSSFKRNTINDYYKKLWDMKKVRYRASLVRAIHLFLTFHLGLSVEKTDIYDREFRYRYSIQPSYVNIEDEDLLNNIISSAPKELNKTEKKKWLKTKIKSMFKYDRVPPRWIQDPEWPIVDGKPLVFKSQTKTRLDDERVWYTFYNEDTLEETVIMQFF